MNFCCRKPYSKTGKKSTLDSQEPSDDSIDAAVVTLPIRHRVDKDESRFTAMRTSTYVVAVIGMVKPVTFAVGVGKLVDNGARDAASELDNYVLSGRVLPVEGAPHQEQHCESFRNDRSVRRAKAPRIPVYIWQAPDLATRVRQRPSLPSVSIPISPCPSASLYLCRRCHPPIVYHPLNGWVYLGEIEMLHSDVRILLTE